jgi:hypothetical protein
MDTSDLRLLSNLTIGGSIGFAIFLVPLLKHEFTLLVGYMFGTVMGYTWFVINTECKCS